MCLHHQKNLAADLADTRITRIRDKSKARVAQYLHSAREIAHG